MAKDPAFLFYPNDYIGGTMGMTFEEKGAYIELLMLQFNRGHMTSHMIGQTVGQLWDNLKGKFTQDKDGLWYNERLEFEQEKRRKYTESRRNNTSGRNQHSDKPKKEGGHMTSHMENRNEDEIESSGKEESEEKNGIKQRLLVFEKEVRECASVKYPEEMIRKFLDYWSEQNPSGTKFKKELEKTWETTRRLSTWANRAEEFSNSRSKKSEGTSKHLPPIPDNASPYDDYQNREYQSFSR